jgi:D-serine deaminase-like pyridoxal phosphate-dependent protein
MAGQIAQPDTRDRARRSFARHLAASLVFVWERSNPRRHCPLHERDRLEEPVATTALSPGTTFVAPDQVIDTPALVVDETIMHTNIAEMAAMAKSFGVNLRPHIKTHKTPEIAKLQIANGAVGLTCAKLGEAEVMADAGLNDLLIAYPFFGELKIKRLLALMEKARVIVSIDSREGMEMLSDAMSKNDRSLEISLEVNTGQNRSGVMWGDEAVQFALEIARKPGLRLAGVFTHEGHANVEGPGRLEEVAIEAGQRVVETAEMIRAHGVEVPTVSVGSTPAAPYTSTVAGVTEMRPGTYVFRDTMGFRYGMYGPDRCAARFYSTVVSHAAPDRCIVDAGSKTLAADLSKGHPGHGFIVGHPGAIIYQVNEEHGSVSIPGDDPGFTIGEHVEIIPNHVCPSVNLHDEMLIIRDGKVVDTWKIAARGKVK